MQLNDAKMRALEGATGQVGQLNDLQTVWLRERIEDASGEIYTGPEALPDLWAAFLDVEGVSGTSLSDRKHRFFSQATGSVGSRADVELNYWESFE